jgi:hypothetical protein
MLRAIRSCVVAPRSFAETPESDIRDRDEFANGNAPNRVRYLRVGGGGQKSESRIPLGCRKSTKMAQHPTHQVHAVLGGLLFARLSVITWLHHYQGFGVAIIVDSTDGVPKGVRDGSAVAWNDIGVGGMPRIELLQFIRFDANNNDENREPTINAILNKIIHWL